MPDKKELDTRLSSFATEFGLNITSGVREPGKNKNSLHPQGKAIDIDDKNLGKFGSFEELQAEATKRGLFVLDERKNPGSKVSPDWSGSHIHLDVRGGDHNHSTEQKQPTPAQQEQFTEIRRNPYDPTVAKSETASYAWSPEMQQTENDIASAVNSNLTYKIPTSKIPQVNLPNNPTTPSTNTTAPLPPTENPYLKAARASQTAGMFSDEATINDITSQIVQNDGAYISAAQTSSETNEILQGFQTWNKEHPILSGVFKTGLTIGGTIGGAVIGGVAGGGVGSIATAPLGAGLGGTAVSSWYSKLAGDEYDLKDAALDFAGSALPTGVGGLIGNVLKGGKNIGLGLKAASVLSGNVDDVVRSTEVFNRLTPFGKVATNAIVTGSSNVISDQILTNVINNSQIPGQQNQADPVQSFIFGGVIGGSLQAIQNHSTVHAEKQLQSLKGTSQDLPPSKMVPNTYIIPDSDAINYANTLEKANSNRLQNPEITQLDNNAIVARINELDLSINQKSLANPTDPRSSFLKKNLDGVIKAEEGVKKAQEAIIAREEQVRLFREGRDPGKNYGKNELIDAKTQAKLEANLKEAQAKVLDARDNLHGFYKAQLGESVDVNALEAEHRNLLQSESKSTSKTKAPTIPDTTPELMEKAVLEAELSGRDAQDRLVLNEQARSQPTILNANELAQNLFKLTPETVTKIQSIEPKSKEDARALGSIEDYLQDLSILEKADRSFLSNVATAFNNSNKAKGLTRADVIGMVRNLPDNNPDKAIINSAIRVLTGGYPKYTASPELQAQLNQINENIFPISDEGTVAPVGRGTAAPEVGLYSESIKIGKDALWGLVKDTEDLNILETVSDSGNYNFTQHQRYAEVKDAIIDKLMPFLETNKNLNQGSIEGISNIATSLVLKTAKRQRISIDEALGRLVFTGKSIEGLYQTVLEAPADKLRLIDNQWASYQINQSRGVLVSLIKELNRTFNAQIILSDPKAMAPGIYDPQSQTITMRPGAEKDAVTHELAHEYNVVLQKQPTLLKDLDGVIQPILDKFPKVSEQFVKYYTRIYNSFPPDWTDAQKGNTAHAITYQEIHSEFYNQKGGVAPAYAHAKALMTELDKYPELKKEFEFGFIKPIDEAFTASKTEVIPPTNILDIYSKVITEGMSVGLIQSPLYQKVRETQAIPKYRESANFQTQDPYLFNRKESATQPTEISKISEQIAKDANDIAQKRKNQGFNQTSQDKILGAFNPNSREIFLSKDANAFTVVHELAHWYESSLTDSERKQILNWAGDTTWGINTSEKFARGFEKYLATKKAPVAFLKDVFKAFAQWGEDLLRGSFGERLNSEAIDRRIQKVYDAMFSEASPRSFIAKAQVDKLRAAVAAETDINNKEVLQASLEEAKARYNIAQAADSLERNFNIKIDKEGFFKPSSPDYVTMNLNFVERGEHFLNKVTAAAHPGDFVDFTTGLSTTTTQIIQQVHNFENRFKTEAIKLAAKLEQSRNITTDSIIKDHPELTDAIVQKKAINEALKQLEAVRAGGFKRSISTEWQLVQAMITDKYKQIASNDKEVRRIVDLAMKKQLDPEYEGNQISKDLSVVKYLQNYLTSATVTSNIGQRSVIGALTRPLKKVIDAMRFQSEDMLGVNPVDHLINRHNWNLINALLDYKNSVVLKLSANGVENMLSMAGYNGLNSSMSRSRLVQDADGINSLLQSSIIGTQNLNALQGFLNNIQQNVLQNPDIINNTPGMNLSREDYSLLSKWGYRVFNWDAMLKGDFENGFANWSPLGVGGFSGFGERDLTSSVPLGKITDSKLSNDPVLRASNTLREAGLMSMRLSTAYGQQQMAENALRAAKEHFIQNKIESSPEKLQAAFNYFYTKLADEGKAGIRSFVAPAFVGDAALIDPRAWGISMDRFIESLWGEDTLGGNVFVNAGRKLTAGVLGATKATLTRYTGWYADESAKQVSNLNLLKTAIEKAPDTQTKLKTLGFGLSAFTLQGALLGINSFAVAAPLVAAFNLLNTALSGEAQESDWAEYSLFTAAYPGWKQDGFQRISASKASFNPSAIASIIISNRDPIRLALAAQYALNGNIASGEAQFKNTLYGTHYKTLQEIMQNASSFSVEDGVPIEDKILDFGVSVLKFLNYGTANSIKKGLTLEAGVLQTPGKTKPSEIVNSNAAGYNMSSATLDAYTKNMFIKTQFLVANTLMGMGFQEVEDANRQRSLEYAAEDPLLQFGIELQN